MTNSATGWRPLLAWLLLMTALLALALPRLQITYDLALFLPAPRDTAQQILVQRVGQSPGSNFIMLAVPNEPARVMRLADRLRVAPGVQSVLTDLDGSGAEMPPEPLWSARYLLADLDWSVAGLRRMLEQRLAELGIGGDQQFEDLVSHDPALLSLEILDRLGAGSDQPWLLDDGRRVLAAISRAPAFDLQAQSEVVQAVRVAVDDEFVGDAGVVLSGAGVFGVQLRDTIQAEATWRSVFASLAIMLVLLLAYRRPGVLLQAAVPLFTGLVTAVTAVSLVFGSIHGITLAFGFTLLGVAIDYPLHFLSHRRHASSDMALARIWPTLRLGAISTVLAYAALMLGGARGMSQLGLFSAAGVAGAALATRWVLPGLVTGPVSARPEGGERALRLRFVPLAAMLAAGLAGQALFSGQHWWSDDLATLSPVPPEKLLVEGQLRAAMGAPNIRYQVALQDENLQSLLEQLEDLRPTLDKAIQQGVLEGYIDAGAFLPSNRVQQLRQSAIPPGPELTARLATAMADLPFSMDAFTVFLEDAAQVRQRAPLGVDDYAGTPLADVPGAYLYQDDTGKWTTLVALLGAPDALRLRGLLEAHGPGVLWIDYRDASARLVADYRARAFTALGGVLALIALLLMWRVQVRRAAWSLTLVVAAVLLSAALLRLLHGPLNLYHLAGLLLVAGIGLDYALFLSKGGARQADNRHAVMACAASTMAAFAVLAASAIPALQALGSAVALGAALCFGGAWISVSQGRQAA